jgi:hypothetical protein
VRTHNTIKVFIIAGLVVASSVPAVAAICAVPGEVIDRTIELENAVTNQIKTSKGLLITEEIRQRQLLLAAIQVLTRQTSGSGQQTSTVVKKSTEASAQAHVAQRQAWKVLDAKDRYGAKGYDSCGLQSKAQQFYGAVKAQDGKARSIAAGTYFKPGEYGSPAAWAALASGNGTFDAEALFSGAGEAQSYINFVVGPPTEEPTASGVGRQMLTISKNAEDARKSVAVEVMASIAAEYDPSGPRAKLEQMTKHWTGNDGGMKWAQAMAAQPLRGALLDAARIEAANLSTLAMQVKGSIRTEMSLSAYALTRIDEIVHAPAGSQNNVIQVRNTP